LIIQSLKNGSPLEGILTDQAAYFRTSRFLDLEKRAQTAPIRILFPLMLFIFPTLFIVLFGAVAMQMAQKGGAFFYDQTKTKSHKG